MRNLRVFFALSLGPGGAVPGAAALLADVPLPGTSLVDVVVPAREGYLLLADERGNILAEPISVSDDGRPEPELLAGNVR